MSANLDMPPAEYRVEKRRSEMLRRSGKFRRAVVLGCGLAGIAAAAALRESCSEVILVEEDKLPPGPAPRHGVPQSHQLHNLLGRAQLELERLLPGFVAALKEVGCGEARVADQTHVWELGRRMPERDLGLRILCAWRPVIDHVALRLLLDQVNVSIRDGVHAIGLEAAPGGEVSGAVVKAEDGRTETIEAEIVVDATGAGSRAGQWLADIEQPQPPIDKARPDQWYVTCLCNRPEAWVGAETFWLIFASPPRTRNGLVSPVTPSQWHVSLSGCSNDQPPRTFKEMQAFAATLEDPTIAALLEHAEASGALHLFRRTIATWRRYDLLSWPLLGFLPVGDAVATMNPLSGQGIAVAVWQASGLANLLRDVPYHYNREDLTRLTVNYLRHTAITCGRSWTLRDLVEQAIRGQAGKADRRSLFSAWIRENPDLHEHYVRIWHLLEPAEALEGILDRLEKADAPHRLG